MLNWAAFLSYVFVMTFTPGREVCRNSEIWVLNSKENT